MNLIEKITAAIVALTALVTAIYQGWVRWQKSRRTEQEPTNPPLLSKRPRILIVDDEPNMAELIRQSLADSYDVRTITSPYRALSEIFEGYERNECYDLIILDQKFVGTQLTGTDMAQIITLVEERQKRCRTRVALLSGIGAILPKQKGIAAIWHKPTDLRNLSQRVNNLINGKE